MITHAREIWRQHNSFFVDICIIQKSGHCPIDELTDNLSDRQMSPSNSRVPMTYLIDEIYVQKVSQGRFVMWLHMQEIDFFVDQGHSLIKSNKNL